MLIVPAQAAATPGTAALESWDPARFVNVSVSAWPNAQSTGVITGLQPYITYDFRVVPYVPEVWSHLASALIGPRKATRTCPCLAQRGRCRPRPPARP